MYRYSITQEEAQKCVMYYLDRYFYKVHIHSCIIVCIFTLMLWLCILFLLQYLQSEYAESGWIRTWPFPGNIIDFFYVFSVLFIVSCLIQRKKFDNLKWCNIVKTEKHQNRLFSTLEKMTKGKSWDELDLMEYDPEKREIKILNKTPKTYSIPIEWEKSLIKLEDNLYYGIGSENAKKILIPFRLENREQYRFDKTCNPS